MYKRILAPLDGSKFSECSLNPLKDIASGCHVSEVILITVIEPMVNLSFWPASRTQAEQTFADFEKNHKQLRKKAEDYLAGIGESLKQSGLSIQIRVVEGQGPERASDMILDFAKNNGVDLIIMSTHGRSGVSRWAFGSTTERIVQRATVPVMTVIPEGCRLPDAPVHYAKV